MAVTPVVIYSGGQLSNVAAAVATAKTNITAFIVTSAVFTNTDSVPHTFSVWVVRSGGTNTSANQLVVSKQLTANQDYIAVDLQGQMLSPGDAIWLQADAASKITCVGISGYQITQ
jgi:hypothetical protein